jgi:hypothetical protein
MAAAAVAAELVSTEAAVCVDAEAQLRWLTRVAADACTAASVASSSSAEPEPGVGIETSRALWDAARAFAVQAYPDHKFPTRAAGQRCRLSDLERGVARCANRALTPRRLIGCTGFTPSWQSRQRRRHAPVEPALAEAVALMRAAVTMTRQTAVHLVQAPRIHAAAGRVRRVGSKRVGSFFA